MYNYGIFLSDYEEFGGKYTIDRRGFVNPKYMEVYATFHTPKKENCEGIIRFYPNGNAMIHEVYDEKGKPNLTKSPVYEYMTEYEDSYDDDFYFMELHKNYINKEYLITLTCLIEFLTLIVITVAVIISSILGLINTVLLIAAAVTGFIVSRLFFGPKILSLNDRQYTQYQDYKIRRFKKKDIKKL